MKFRVLSAIAALTLALAGCDRPEALGPTAEQLALRESAWRRACVSRELLQVAADDVATLEATFESFDPADPIGEISRRATTAALDFSRAFYRHAELRSRAYAQLDSAVNHAATTADSARFVERAGAFTIRPPEEGSVEANVIADYVQRLDAILADDDHRCNWDTPF